MIKMAKTILNKQKNKQKTNKQTKNRPTEPWDKW